MTTNITLFGAAGRMGQTLCELIIKDDALELVGALEHLNSQALNQNATKNSDVVVTSDFAVALKDADVVIDFALGENIGERIQACRDANVAMLIGTTGLTETQLEMIQAAGEDIPILWASNMSLGVNIVFAIAAQVAQSLGLESSNDFSINITETHHIHKLDAPSGTALSIGQSVHDAIGNVKIEYDSYREGEVIGDHTIAFESDDELIEITHHAKDRSLFAKGALRLANLLAKKEKGTYQVRDLL